MTFARLLVRLAPFDMANVRRDALLVWVPLAPILFALAIRFGYGPVQSWLSTHWQFDVSPYEALLVSFLFVLGPTMAGMVVGFLLLDERDEGVLRVMLVTPVPMGTFLSYRLALPVLLGFVCTLIAYPIAGLLPLPILGVAACAALAAVGAPLFALVLVLFAEDKVSGFVVMKVVNVVNLVPIAAFFLPSDVAWLPGILPTYWPLDSYWSLAAGEPVAVTMGIGLTVNVAWLGVLHGRLEDSLRR